MSTFDESKHPRGSGGKFAAKPAGEAEVTLTPIHPDGGGEMADELRDGTAETNARIEAMAAMESASEDQLVSDATWVADRLAQGRAPGLSVRFERSETEDEGYASYTVSYTGGASAKPETVTRSVDQLHDDTSASGPAAAAGYVEKFLADYALLRAKSQA